MASAAIPMLVGTGISLIGAKQGWDPRLTALASMAGGGIAGGMASGALGTSVGAQAAGTGGSLIGGTGGHRAVGLFMNPAGNYVAPSFVGPTSSLADPLLSGSTNVPQSIGTVTGSQWGSSVDPASPFMNWVKGPQGKALGADMLKTFLDYEIALANEPTQWLRSGGGGGGGGGRAPAYPGGGQTGQKSVVWSYPEATGMYQPKALA